MMAAHIAWRLVRRAAVNLWRAPLPSLVSVLTIALALFLGASFAVGVLSARRLLQGWGAEPSVTLYLDRSTSDDEAKALAGRIAETERTESVRYVDRAQALQRLRTELGDLGSALDGLPENPLPPSVEVIPAGSPGPNEVRALASRLGQLSHVVEVDYGREWLDRIEVLGRSMRNFGSGALALVLTAALLVVANTIRLAVYARRDEIEIMKLVGATNAYVRTPFLLEGMLQGLAGALLAVVGLEIVQRLVIPRAAAAFSFAAGAAAPHLAVAHFGILAGAGAVVGLLGSYLAVARFLRA
ncbi:MAG: ABC transporter permease [Deltaproteobacteria bacterium]|nr:MAG: ABC transporter permease [Deltaproteobacteria bacterium]TMB27089.1 MAG: ABC transporter permease [Deltaproteobacteria bacterium]TMB31377.1 MAG: ABC transporter permease [Deltaproteobacteria bacterium]